MVSTCRVPGAPGLAAIENGIAKDRGSHARAGRNPRCRCLGLYGANTHGAVGVLEAFGPDWVRLSG